MNTRSEGTATRATAGALIRRWRDQRRLSQQHLGASCGVSARHLSFVETGRSRPSADMILRLCAFLDVPLRSRNDILLAAGHAPAFAETSLDGPSTRTVGAALIRILDGHLPCPAAVVDRHWNLVDSNSAIDVLVAGSAPELLEPPANVLRLSLHPRGMAPRIRNLAQWKGHILSRLDSQIRVTGDETLKRLRSELSDYPGDADHAPADSLVVPLRLSLEQGELSFFSATTVFGAPMDVTLAELAIESFFPADEATQAAFRDGLDLSQPS